MKQYIDKTKQYDDEINLFEIIDILIQSKTIIILTTLIFTILAFIYSVQKKPTYQSSVLIEIGHYETSSGPIELLESPNSIIQNLNINLKYKLDNALDTEINVIENRLIEIKHSSESTEKNVDVLNQFINYLDKKHSSLSDTSYQEKIKEINMELDYINSEIENDKKFERLKLSSQIRDLDVQIPSFDLQISNFKKIISEDEENLRLLKDSPDLYLERTSKNPTLNQVIHEYKLTLDDLILKKASTINRKTKLEEQLNLLENNQLPPSSAMMFQLSQRKTEIETKLKNLENQNFSKTQLIGEINSRQIDTNKLTISLWGFFAGLIFSVFLVFVGNFIKTYRESKA